MLNGENNAPIAFRNYFCHRIVQSRPQSDWAGMEADQAIGHAQPVLWNNWSRSGRGWKAVQIMEQTKFNIKEIMRNYLGRRV